MDSQSFRTVLDELRVSYGRRLGFRYFLRGLVWGAAAALVWTFLVRAFALDPVWDALWLKAVLLLIGGFIGMVPLSSELPSAYALAKRLDDELEWGDQLGTAYSLQSRADSEPMVSIVVKDAREKMADAKFSRALPSPEIEMVVAAVFIFGVAFGLMTKTEVVEQKTLLEEETRQEMHRQVKKLDDLLLLEVEDLTEEDKEHFDRIRKMIEQLQLEDKRLSRKELLARFSREIEGLEDLEDSSEALKKALEQLKETKDAIASRMLVRRQIEEIEEQHVELAVVDEKSGQKLKAEEIEVMVVQEERRRQQEAMAKEMKEVAEEEARGEVTKWTESTEGHPAEAGDGGTVKKKKKVTISYEDLVKAAEKKNIREMIFTAAANVERDSSEYREVYVNYRRAFTSLLYQGNLSLGTRQYLKRYFRAMRPQTKKAENPK